MRVAAEDGIAVASCIVLALTFVVRIDPAVYTAYPPVSGPCIAEGGRRGKEEVRKIPERPLAYEHLVAYYRLEEPFEYFAGEDCEAVGLVEIVAC
jgi:hypothetical protein